MTKVADDDRDSTPSATSGEERKWKWRGNRRCHLLLALTVVVLAAVGLLVGLLVPRSRRENVANESVADANDNSDLSGADVEDDGAAPPGVVDSEGGEGAPPDQSKEEEEDSADDVDSVVDSIVEPHERWPHDESDIPPDPEVLFGTLDNGLRFAVMSNPEPPTRLSLRLHIRAGSLNEDEDQLGLAHFLEHMMFNGLLNFPDASDLIKEMQRLGVEFGTHLNAYTSYDETVYKLDLPNMDNYTVGLGFKVLRDWADGAILDDDEIELERDVVISEVDLRDSVEYRIFLQQLEFLVPEHRITHRKVVGTKEVLETVPRQRFQDFYKQYYVPSRMTLIAVGDVNDGELKLRIHDAFSSMSEQDEGAIDPDIGMLPDVGFRTAAFVDGELTYDLLSLESIREYQPVPDTKTERTRRLLLELAHTIVSRRFEDISREEGSLILIGGAYRDFFAQALDWASVYIVPSNGHWEDAVPVLEQEFRRVLEHGFTATELDEAKADILDSYDEAVKKAPSRRSKSLANRLRNTVSNRRVFSSPEEDLRIAEKALVEATPQLVHDIFRDYWIKEDLSLLLTARDAPTDAADILKTLHEESSAVEVVPLEEEDAGSFNYTYFGPSGTVISDVVVNDLDIRQLVLSNNVRVNMKRTDFQANSIEIVARFGTGRLGQPENITWLDRFAEDVMAEGGLGEHTLEELERIFAGRTVSLSFHVKDGAFVLTGNTAPDDLHIQLQLLAASLSNPGYRKPQFHQFVPNIMAQLKHTFSGAYSHVNAWLWGGDKRFAVPTQEGLMSLEVTDVFDWVHGQLLGDYLEVSIVGDLPNTTLSLILDTIGALPTVRAEMPPVIELEDRFIAFPNATSDLRVFTYETKLLQGAAILAWRIPALYSDDVGTFRRLNLLSRILDDRMMQRIREDLGDSYSPQAGTIVSEAFDFGMILAMSPGSPSDSGPIIEVIVDIAKNIASDVTEDELARAKKPFQTHLEESLRDNSYWLRTVMEECQSKPYMLDWSRQRDEDYESITLEEMKTLAAEYLTPERALRIEVLPVSGNETEAASQDSERKLNLLSPLPSLINIPDPVGTRFFDTLSLA